MSIVKRDAFELVCDEPRCGYTTFDMNGEFSFWGERDQAINDWRNNEGQFNDKTGEAWCHQHSKPVCLECDAFAPVNDDSECAECAA